MDFGALKEKWWKTLTEQEKAQYTEFRAYIRMRNYVESDGEEEALGSCTFRYIVTAMKGTLEQGEMRRLAVALDDWKIMKLDNYILGIYEDTKDTVKLARDLISFNVLHEKTLTRIIDNREIIFKKTLVKRVYYN